MQATITKPSDSMSQESQISPEPMADVTVGPMYRFQRTLPNLPVPTLTSTAAKYLETVEPLVNKRAYEETKKVVNRFVASEQGKELQRRLEARAAMPGMVNWLNKWSSDVTYLGRRGPALADVSYFYVHLDDPRCKGPVSRAASLVKALLPFRDLVESQKLEPEMIRGQALDMSSYKWLFNACRYPTKPSDTAKKFDPKTHQHIILVRKNKFYEVPVIVDGVELNTKELELQISKVISLAGLDSGPAVGALTSEHRDTWTDAREAMLRASPINSKSLERIESSIVVIALDDLKPVTREAVSQACWVGDGKNRFYDKHQIIVFENGKSGMLCEHSNMDGTSSLRLTEFMLSAISHNKINHGPKVIRAGLAPPVELKFDLDTLCAKYIAQAEKHVDKLIGAHDLEVLLYEGYGRRTMKKFRASPDAWAQLIKQLAFYKMFGRSGVAYESAQTRKFQLGRTEVIRSSSKESKLWVEAMLDPAESDVKRAALFSNAVARHLKYATWAADGQGIDRHFFGLKQMLKDGETLPDIFTDQSFDTSNHWELSTSNLYSPYIDGWGHGEAMPDGYGLSYSIGDHYIRWTITSRKRNTAGFKHYLEESATEVVNMMTRAAKGEASTEMASPEAKL